MADDLPDFKGRPVRIANEAALPEWQARALDYVIWDDGLEPAIHSALLLGKPLLLTGEPGTGKTTLADRIALTLGLEEPLPFLTKSTSVATDLFYSYDALGRLQAAYSDRESGRQDGGASARTSAADFVSFNALGTAILRSTTREHLPDAIRPFRDDSPPRRSVVLIDEIDKANRDFPNDLLYELDRLEFRVQELQGAVVKAGPERGLRPLVVITSNSEKSLPDAFLRRCIFHHLTFPANQELLASIVVPQVFRRTRRRFAQDGRFARDCIAFFEKLRAAGMTKPPATAEIVDWMTLLESFKADVDRPLAESPAALRKSIHALAKFVEDLALAKKAVEETIASAAQPHDVKLVRNT